LPSSAQKQIRDDTDLTKEVATSYWPTASCLQSADHLINKNEKEKEKVKSPREGEKSCNCIDMHELLYTSTCSFQEPNFLKKKSAEYFLTSQEYVMHTINFFLSTITFAIMPFKKTITNSHCLSHFFITLGQLEKKNHHTIKEDFKRILGDMQGLYGPVFEKSKHQIKKSSCDMG
jgi:hypothetical protein